MNPIFAWIIGDTTARSMVETTRPARDWHTQAAAFTRTSGKFYFEASYYLGEAGVI